MAGIAMLLLRVSVGGLLAGHGAQKLFGWFGGSGPKATATAMESMGLRPGALWAPVAGVAEFGGGVLTALGLLNPLGPISIMAAMTMATAKAHWGKPIWNTEGGAELPVTYLTAALAIALAGPGRYSVDSAISRQVPANLVGAAAVLAAAGVMTGIAAPALLTEGTRAERDEEAA
jgi:putative oxidoreductase